MQDDASFDVRAEHSAGWSAFAYIIVVVIAGLIPGNPPAINAAPTDIGAWVNTHQQSLLIAAWLSFPGLAFFLWYVVGLRAHLMAAPGQNEGLGTYFMIAGVVAAALAVLNAFFQALLGYRAAELAGPEVRVLYDAFALSGVLLYAPLAVYTYAASYSALRHHSFPRAFSWFGYLSAVLLAISTLSIFFKDGALRPNAGIPLIAFVLYAIWTVWTGIVLVRQPRSRPQYSKGELPSGK